MQNWQITQTANATEHTSRITDTTNLRQAVEACAAHAISLLKDNIQDDSLYLMFEWNGQQCSLSAVVTDASKQQDAPQKVSCHFAGLADELDQNARTATMEELTENIKFWLHDYFTTCTAFFSYSLVAIFHKNTRANTELL